MERERVNWCDADNLDIDSGGRKHSALSTREFSHRLTHTGLRRRDVIKLFFLKKWGQFKKLAMICDGGSCACGGWR